MPRPKLGLTEAERNRRMKLRRILRLRVLGWKPSQIAADSKVGYTVQRVRQILAECRERYQEGDFGG